MSGDDAAHIDVIGIDDSGPSGLPARALELVQTADLICGGRRHLALFPAAGRERFAVTGDLEALYCRLSEGRFQTAIVLASGDPGFYGIGPLLAERFGREQVSIHPHASSVSLAFARLGLAWHDATVLSAHGRPIDEIVPAALSASKLAILTDPDHTPAAIAQQLTAAGMPDCSAYVCERLGSAAERVHQTTLRSLPDREFDPLNVLVLLPGEGVAPPLALGRPDELYSTVRGQITKAEVRVIALSRLEPWHARTCWDVGAGAGSIAIEAAGLMTTGAVYAVERDTEQLAALTENVQRFRAARVRVIAGSAPEALGPLPDPDAVFVGGSGSALTTILRLVAARLRPAGRLVANFALLESLSDWQAVAQELGWRSDVSQVSVSHGEQLGNGTHLSPLGPVFITRLVRPEAKV